MQILKKHHKRTGLLLRAPHLENLLSQPFCSVEVRGLIPTGWMLYLCHLRLLVEVYTLCLPLLLLLPMSLRPAGVLLFVP